MCALAATRRSKEQNYQCDFSKLFSIVVAANTIETETASDRAIGLAYARLRTPGSGGWTHPPLTDTIGLVNHDLAFLFDMDGVIIDSTALHTEVWQAYLSPLGIAAVDLENRMLGRHNAALVRDLFSGHTLSEQEVQTHGARKEALYREMVRPVFLQKLVPGVVQFILRHQALPMAIGTNAEHANVALTLDLAGIRECFRVIVDGNQVSHPKPHPEIYLTAARLLGAEPQNCIVFEDSLTGIAAGKAAGMRVIGLKTTMAEMDGVDLAVNDFLDPSLEAWLRESH